MTHVIEVGLHPTSIVLDEARQRLYVANSNSDSISVVDTNRNALLQNIPIQPLILVVEDDAQAGLDHVDGHRTVAQVISPYSRRGAIDSAFYSQASMVKTIELILGLPTMSLFDLIANDMRNSFQAMPVLTPYTSETPKQSIYEVNPKLNALSGQALKAAKESLRMNFRDPDSAPTAKVNRMIWASVRG